jgi:outer membrane protein assembly factor BamB
MNTRHTRPFLASLACLAASSLLADWPQFRGPAATGTAPGGFPTHFGPGTNEVWSVPLAAGNSSPVISGDRIFLTAWDGSALRVASHSTLDGHELWNRSLPPGNIERGARLGNPATATPATDGERVVAYFGAFGLACFNVTGEELWRHPLPVPITQHGAGTSPILAGDLVLLNCDQDFGSYLLAVDKRTGKHRWRRDRPHALRGFSTPLAWPPSQPTQVVVSGTLRLDAYNLTDGSPAWHVNGLPNEMVSSPIPGDGVIHVAGWTAGSGVGRMPAWDGILSEGDRDHDGELTQGEAPGGPAKQHFAYLDADKNGRLSKSEYTAAAHAFDASRNVAMAVRPDGSGDRTSTAIVWSHGRGLPYCPTPLLLDGRLHLLRNGGLLTCLDAKSGKVFYQEERIGALGDNYASPVGSNGRLCVFSQAGVGVVLRSADHLEVLARNELGESVVATPAMDRGHLYVRSASRLWKFGDRGPHQP